MARDGAQARGHGRAGIRANGSGKASNGADDLGFYLTTGTFVVLYLAAA